MPESSVRILRERLGMTQERFAATFGFNLATLRNWEQGRKSPDGAARVLLMVIEREPEAVESAVKYLQIQFQESLRSLNPIT